MPLAIVIMSGVTSNDCAANGSPVLPQPVIASSNIRRQIKRLKDLFLIENIDTSYRIVEFENLNKIFEEKIESFYLKNILARVKEYLQALEKE